MKILRRTVEYFMIFKQNIFIINFKSKGNNITNCLEKLVNIDSHYKSTEINFNIKILSSDD